ALDFFGYTDAHVGYLEGLGAFAECNPVVQDTPARAQSTCWFSDILANLWHFLPRIRHSAQGSVMALDRFDKKILAELQRDGRISNVELAGRVSLSESACLRRVRSLEQAGLIERYVAL